MKASVKSSNPARTLLTNLTKVDEAFTIPNDIMVKLKGQMGSQTDSYVLRPRLRGPDHRHLWVTLTNKTNSLKIGHPSLHLSLYSWSSWLYGIYFSLTIHYQQRTWGLIALNCKLIVDCCRLPFKDTRLDTSISGWAIKKIDAIWLVAN